EDFEAVGARHLEVEQHQAGERILVANGIFSHDGEVEDGLLSVADDVERVFDACPLESLANEQDVSCPVFGQKNDLRFRHKLWKHLRELRAWGDELYGVFPPGRRL